MHVPKTKQLHHKSSFTLHIEEESGKVNNEMTKYSRQSCLSTLLISIIRLINFFVTDLFQISTIYAFSV